jgi:hypothetical protein
VWRVSPGDPFAAAVRAHNRYNSKARRTACRSRRRYITGTLDGACTLEHARLSYRTGPDVTRHISEWTTRKRDASAKLFCAGLRTSPGCVLTGRSSTEQTARQYKTISRVLAGSDVRVSAETGVPGAHTTLGKTGLRACCCSSSVCSNPYRRERRPSARFRLEANARTFNSASRLRIVALVVGVSIHHPYRRNT